jgi:hypothetical protein
MQPQLFFTQIKSTSGDVVTIDITSSSRKATFNFDRLPAKMGNNWCYAQIIRLHIRTQVDQPAMGGTAINADQLYRILESITLKSDDLGQLYAEGDINGPQLGLIAQVIGGGYSMYIQRAQIAAADGDTAITLTVDIPIAQHCFVEGHQTGIWNGHLRNGGQLEVNLAASTALAAVSTGAALEATTDVRAEVLYTAEPEVRVPAIWLWRQRQTPANETKHTIRNVCQGKGLAGPLGVGKLAFLAYMSDQNGLGGADGIDNIQRVYPVDRGQSSHSLSTPHFGTASYLYEFIRQTRKHLIFPDSAGNVYPFAMGTSVNGVPNVATALYLPLVWPHAEGQKVSKLQEISGDYAVEFDYAATPSAAGIWLSLEQCYLSEAQKDFLMGERMGLPPSAFRRHPKVKTLMGDADVAKLRGVPEKVRAAR